MEGDVIELSLKLKCGSVHLVEICFGVNWVCGLDRLAKWKDV